MQFNFIDKAKNKNITEVEVVSLTLYYKKLYKFVYEWEEKF